MELIIVDVFAEKPLAGNQLAVVRDAAGLTDQAMQDIAREMNFSETTFVTSEAEGRASVRIFTPESELPEDATAERADMLERGVRSQIVLPLLSERRFVGLLAMECLSYERDWPEETVTLLRLAGEILVSAMRRMRTARELHEQLGAVAPLKDR